MTWKQVQKVHRYEVRVEKRKARKWERKKEIYRKRDWGQSSKSWPRHGQSQKIRNTREKRERVRGGEEWSFSFFSSSRQKASGQRPQMWRWPTSSAHRGVGRAQQGGEFVFILNHCLFTVAVMSLFAWSRTGVAVEDLPWLVPKARVVPQVYIRGRLAQVVNLIEIVNKVRHILLQSTSTSILDTVVKLRTNSSSRQNGKTNNAFGGLDVRVHHLEGSLFPRAAIRD